MNFKKYLNTDKLIRLKRAILNIVDSVLIILSLIAFFAVLYDLGFQQKQSTERGLQNFYSLCLATFFIAFLIKIILQFHKKISRGRRISEFIVFLVLLLIALFRFTFFQWYATYDFLVFLANPLFINLVFITIFLIEISKYSLNLDKLNVNPPLLFVASFFMLILFGTGLLLLPKATVGGISVVDALFTSTSAVCVTGLIVVDTATYFTLFGKIVILMLIQVGGLGVMTFTSFFGFFFKGSYSLENQLFLKDFINEDKLGEIFKTLSKIIFFTLFVELLGALMIFSTLDAGLIDNTTDKIQFAIFHSISAFCNAGFSTLTNGLYEEGFRVNYNLHLIIAFLIVVGGIGFPVIFNFYNYLKHVFTGARGQIISRKEYQHAARVVNINTKIIVYTTIILLVSGFVLFFIAEYNHALKGLTWYGKIVTSIFGSVTPRTAGFNTIDMTAMTLPTVLIYLILMWIGASPGSTGGGLKTSTFAVAVLNTISIAKGKDRVEVFRREITNESVRKAFAVILLSFLVIGLAVFFVMLFDPDKRLIKVAFECFSAFSTVGLSLGITGDLSSASKIVVSITMFLGRVGTLTMLIAFIRKVKTLNYRYPDEGIFIT